MTRPLRIGFLTDLHAREALPGTAAYPERRSREMFQKLPRALDTLVEQGIDLLVVGGDILDVPEAALDGDPPALAEFRAPALADYRQALSALRKPGVPVLSVPGNHDRIDWMHEVFPTDGDSDPVSGLRALTFADAQGEAFMPYRVGNQWTRFQQALQDPRPQLHLQHYILTPCLNDGYPHSYPNGEGMADALAESLAPVLCLSGHYHKGAELTQRGFAWFFTGQAFCETPHPFYRIEWVPGEAPVVEGQELCSTPS